MTKSDFLRCIEELVEAPAESLDLSQELSEIDHFDSYTIVGIMSYADSLGIAVDPDDFADVKTLGDIFAHLSKEA